MIEKKTLKTLIALSKKITQCVLFCAATAQASTVVVAMDNSSSTMESRAAIAKQCASQFTEAVRDPKVNQVRFLTIGSAKNPSISDAKKIGPRDYSEYMTRESAIQHFSTMIMAFPKRLESGKVRLDNSSAIYNGIFYDSAPMLRLSSGAPPESGTLVVCSDFIENEVIQDVTKMSLPSPPSGALRNIKVYGIGIGLGLDSIEQNFVRDNWIKAMRQAGADFVPMKVR